MLIAREHRVDCWVNVDKEHMVDCYVKVDKKNTGLIAGLLSIKNSVDFYFNVDKEHSVLLDQQRERTVLISGST